MSEAKIQTDLTWPKPERLFRELPIQRIKSRPARYSTKDLHGLRDSIGFIGLLNPVTVAQDRNGQYEVVAGAGRFSAAKALGLKKIWCAVLPHAASSAAAELAFLHENIHRVPLTDLEHDVALKRMVQISQELNEARTTKAANQRRAEAGREAGKLGGRGHTKPKPSRKTSSRGSAEKETRARESEHATAVVARQAGVTPQTVRAAVQRTERGAKSVLEAYGEGKLTRQQVTLLSRLAKPEQEELLPSVLAARGAKATGLIESRLTQHRREEQATQVLLRDLNRLNRLADGLSPICVSVLHFVAQGLRPEGTARLRSKLLKLSATFQEIVTALTPPQEN